MLCGTDDKVPGIKNGGRIAVIEAGLQNQMVQVRAQRLSEQTIYMYSIQINNIDKLKKTLVTFLAQEAKVIGNNMERLKRLPSAENIYLDIEVHNSWKSLA